MNHRQFTSCVRIAAGVLFVASFAAVASAQSNLAERVLTFSAPVRVPGTTLPAGTYLFRRVEVNRQGGSIQVFTVKPQRLVATVQASAVNRNGGASHVTLWQTPAGVTPAIATVYLSDNANDGFEFVYSSAERRELAVVPVAAGPVSLPVSTKALTP
jgi:hypothetical protein